MNKQVKEVLMMLDSNDKDIQTILEVLRRVK